MNIKEAVEKRIIQLCEEHNLAVNSLANISGVSPSTIYSMLNEKSKNPGVVSIKKICDGLEISIKDFFDSELFDNLEQEINNGLHRSVDATHLCLLSGVCIFLLSYIFVVKCFADSHFSDDIFNRNVKTEVFSVIGRIDIVNSVTV